MVSPNPGVVVQTVVGHTERLLVQGVIVVINAVVVVGGGSEGG